MKLTMTQFPLQENEDVNANLSYRSVLRCDTFVKHYKKVNDNNGNTFQR